MNQPKRHHYIPVMILKRFTADDGRLWLCRQEGEEPKFWQTLPENAFLEKNLYAKRDKSGNRDMSVEEDLSDVESATSPVINGIVSRSLERKCPCLPDNDRKKLIRFVLHQQRRDSRNRELVEASLRRELNEFPDAFETKTGRPLSDDALALSKDPEFRKTEQQNSFSSFAGTPPIDSMVQAYAQFPFEFGVIRIKGSSFVIGNHVRAFDWFPIDKQMALRLVVGNGSDQLTEFRDMAESCQINEQTARNSITFAGSSEQLVRSLAQVR